LLLLPPPFESACNQRRLAVSPRRSLAKAGHASRGRCNLSEKTDKLPLALPTANAFRSAYYTTNPADHAKFCGHNFPGHASLNSLALSTLPTPQPRWSLSGSVPAASRHLAYFPRPDKRKYLALNTKRTPESVGLCPETRPDGGTNSLLAAPTCRAEASERRRESDGGRPARHSLDKGGSSPDPRPSTPFRSLRGGWG
jgi:hypothetical protein